MLFEAALGVVVLGVTAGLVNAAPARVAYAKPIDVTVPGVMVKVCPVAVFAEVIFGAVTIVGASPVVPVIAFEVMTAVRADTRPMSAAAAREERVACSGTHFDPHIVRAFLRVSIGRLPRAAAWVVPLAQLPGVVGAWTSPSGPTRGSRSTGLEVTSDS